ncbi:MAG: hypothetical protein AAF607_12140 [Pseudomonadota bacterium]
MKLLLTTAAALAAMVSVASAATVTVGSNVVPPMAVQDLGAPAVMTNSFFDISLTSIGDSVDIVYKRGGGEGIVGSGSSEVFVDEVVPQSINEGISLSSTINNLSVRATIGIDSLPTGNNPFTNLRLAVDGPSGVVFDTAFGLDTLQFTFVLIKGTIQEQLDVYGFGELGTGRNFTVRFEALRQVPTPAAGALFGSVLVGAAVIRRRNVRHKLGIPA